MSGVGSINQSAENTAAVLLRVAQHIQNSESSAANRLLRESLPDAEHPLLARGLELWRGNRPRLALKALAEYCASHPGNVLAWQVRAHLLVQLGAIDEGIQCLATCLELHPELLAIRPEFANLLARRQRFTEALEVLEPSLVADPGNRELRLLKAALLDRSGQYPPAMLILEEVLQQDAAMGHPDPADSAKTWTALGMLQRTIGDQAAAISSLQQASELDPGSGWPWIQLSDFKVYTFNPGQLEKIRRGLGQAKPGSMNEVHFSFALGRAEESLGNVDAAFAAYSRGNRVRAAMAPFDLAAHRRDLAALLNTFSSELIQQTQPTQQDSCPAIFVVGLPRSGTTLVDQILSAHSQVDGTMELPIISTLIREFQQRQIKAGKNGYPQAITSLESTELQQLGQEYLHRARVQRGNAPCFVDKMPFNFQHVGLIRLMLPGARIVNVRREPMAMGFSIFRQLFRFGQDWAFDLQTIGEYYLAYQQLMQHWDEVAPGLVTHVQYEQLVSSPETTTKELLRSLQLEDEPACYKPHENQRPVRTASSEQVRQPLYTDAIDYWQRFEKHLEPLQLLLSKNSQ